MNLAQEKEEKGRQGAEKAGIFKSRLTAGLGRGYNGVSSKEMHYEIRNAN
ncbi:MAG: hypothetical protein IJC29_05595 [Clostridia bacterium]|nr:hypothetical protein [Clostridia bacterium]